MKWFYAVAVVFAACVLLFDATSAGASTYSYDCPAVTDDLTTSSADTTMCLALADRLERLDADSADLQARLDLVWTGIWFASGTTFGVWAFRRLGKQAKLWGHQ